jgi:hypothetical protein
MRGIHARCVKFFHCAGLRANCFVRFVAVSAKKAFGIVRAKDISEIRLTAGEIQVEFADCPRTKTQTEQSSTYEEHE